MIRIASPSPASQPLASESTARFNTAGPDAHRAQQGAGAAESASAAPSSTPDTAAAAAEPTQISVRGASLLRNMASLGQPIAQRLLPAGERPQGAGGAISELVRDTGLLPRNLPPLDNVVSGPLVVPIGIPTAGAPGSEPIGPAPQRPNPQQAAEILERDFDTFLNADTGGALGHSGDPTKINDRDLRAVAENTDGRFSQEQQDVAQLLLDSPGTRRFFERAADDLFVGGITREGVQAARQSLENGSYVGRMLDQAMNPLVTSKELGIGPNGEVLQPQNVGRVNMGKEGLEQIAKDPGVPQNVRDAAMLLSWENSGGADLNDVAHFTTEHADAASAVVGSSGWAPLARDQKNIVAQAFRRSQANPEIMRGIQTALERPEFQHAPSAEQSSFLNMLARFHGISLLGGAVSGGALTDMWAYLK